MTSSIPALNLVNLRRWNGHEFVPDQISIANGEIHPTYISNASTLDLENSRVVPAFLNAHDHLELNHYPRTKYRDTYPNSHQWGEEVNQRLSQKPLSNLRKHSYVDKIRVGLIKNFLSGVLTVMQHGEPRKELFATHSSVQVIQNYKWAHSLHFSTPDEMRTAHENTPAYGRFYIHLAEGTDDLARSEYKRLRDLGCVDQRTVFVHGVGMIEDDIADAMQHGCTLVTCPTTNHYLLGAVAQIPQWGNQVVLGSDSRLTASGDFLDEMCAFAHHWGDSALWTMLHNSHPRLALPEAPSANLVVLGDHLHRTNVRLIFKKGVPLMGEPKFMNQFPNMPQVDAILDGQPRRIQTALARWLTGGKLREAGLHVDLPFYRRWWWIRST